ncbi:MFS general substrate transporter [Pluteus cervinus]|uniref:MFS general substrate transporter n=1 Tax=Pluteus cervinus TaxID=181527 RepID=A0ACD3B8I6_9AGAR|nr:MFS general substrate transporter [Pluteus cervinus]
MSASSKSSTSEKRPQDAEKQEVDSQFEKRTIRLVDVRLLPLLGLLYAVALVDRTNLGVARIAGMGADLGLDLGQRYSIASFIYFIPYILLQLPGNVILKILGARTWLTICVVGWGATQLGMGWVRTWEHLVATRVFLGAFEAGFFPALVFIITTWYKRHEVQKRLAIFYIVSIVIGGFSAIFAYGLTFLGGKAGLAGWRWIFIIEGLLTMVLGALFYLFVADFPDRNRFLTEEQTQLVLARVEADRGDSIPDPLTLSKILEHLRDWTIWAYALMFMCATMPAYAIGFFVTIILAGMGWGIRDSLLLSAPPYVFAAISAFGFAYISDKTKKRGIFIIIQTLISIIGLLITGYVKNNGARYFGLFLVNAGASGCIPAILAYNANNVTTHSKRAVSTAIIVGFGGVGGIFATTVYREEDFPRYLNGIWATLGCQFLMIVLVAALEFTYHRRNAAAAQDGVVLEGQPGFTYTL